MGNVEDLWSAYSEVHRKICPVASVRDLRRPREDVRWIQHLTVRSAPVTTSRPSSPVGLHRVLEPAGALPQAAQRLDDSPEIAADEVRVAVQRLNLDAASFRQLATKHGGDGEAVRREVLDIVAARGKMQNPVTGSGGMLVGVVDEVGPESPPRARPWATGWPPWCPCR